MRKLLLLLVMVLGMVSLASAQENETDDGTVIIGPSQIGVVFDPASGDLLDPLGPGTHEVLPPLTVTIYSTAQQSFTLTGQMDMNGVRGDEAVNARTLEARKSSLMRHCSSLSIPIASTICTFGGMIATS